MTGLESVARATRRRLLARDGAAARHRRRAAGRPQDPDPRRAGQRTRPGGRHLGARTRPPPGGPGPHDLPLLAPDERDGSDRRPHHRARPRPGHRRRPGRDHRSAWRPERPCTCAPPTPTGSRPLLTDGRRHGHASRAGLLEVGGLAAPQIGELAARERVVLHELSPVGGSLEDAYLALTQDEVEYHAGGTAHSMTTSTTRPRRTHDQASPCRSAACCAPSGSSCAPCARRCGAT